MRGSRARAPRLARSSTSELDLLALVIIWGVNFSVVKVVLQGVEPLAFNALRFPFAALTVWILMRAQRRPLMPRTCSSWYAAAASAASISSLATVLKEAPVTRAMARWDMPSASIPTICTRLAVGSLFIRKVY